MSKHKLDAVIKYLNILIPILLLAMLITLFTGHFTYSYKIFTMYIISYLSRDFVCGFAKSYRIQEEKNKVLLNDIISKPTAIE